MTTGSHFTLKCLMYWAFPCSELPRARAAPASCPCYPWCQSVYRLAGTVFPCWCPQKCLGSAPATAEAKEPSQWAASICSLFWRRRDCSWMVGVLLLGLRTEDAQWVVLSFYIDITVQTGSKTSCSEPWFFVHHAGLEQKTLLWLMH